MRSPSRPFGFALLAAAVAWAAPAQDAAPVNVIGKLAAPAPAGWKAEKPANRLRSAQFKLPGFGGMPDGELIVQKESSPDTEKNFPRWKAQFVPPEGKTTDELGKVTKFAAGKAAVTALDVSGTWKYKAAPFDPKSKEELKDGYRVVWAVVVAGDDCSHVRVSGPEAVVAKYYPGVETWLKGLK